MSCFVTTHPVSDIAYGEKRRVELAMALAQKPRVLLLDEPLAGLSNTERSTVKALIASGKTLDQILAAKPTAQWDPTWGAGFAKPDFFVSMVYRSLTGSRPTGPK